MIEKKQTDESLKRRVGLLGGTFDPIHMAHLIIAEAAYDAFDLDEVLLMPSGHSYFKDDREQKVLPPEIRYAMTCEAASDNPHFTASDFEIHRPGNTYTCDTLRELRMQNPENHYFFIVGADTVLSILTWKNPEQIFADCTLLAAIREDGIPTEAFLKEVERLRKDYGADIHVLEIPAIGISSTDIRNRIKNGRTVHYLVPERVERYIIEKGIYK
ncbi:nicotinate-nucleotide adenylyltransferase [Sarcina sp. DSM 11001]|uniref:nicotinate-nucleotide adenylyltransferase n=1 Tax=Sarcina sp. DSM 11001 TaxID=1798184 RepID=UPI0008823EF0|nr:nicotinate-nucleotide adenylyltransferase [Sarcina sp. DSM 11001]SDK57764.1 nicotinate-nucleotide adenylyltransferase [Sarcina sp. DSM 11001]